VWPCHLVICIMVADVLLVLWLVMLIIYAYDYGYITVVLATLVMLSSGCKLNPLIKQIWIKLESKYLVLVAV
jgi:hypothetical protein